MIFLLKLKNCGLILEILKKVKSEYILITSIARILCMISSAENGDYSWKKMLMIIKIFKGILINYRIPILS